MESLKDKRGYKGFLIIECPQCGHTKKYCAKSETTNYFCRECGLEIELDETNMRPLFMNCKCGKEAKYRTNITSETYEVKCLQCGQPVDICLNRRGTAYVTVGAYQRGNSMAKKDGRRR